MELTGIKIGIVGMGTVGSLTAKTLDFFGADLYYFSRTRKEAVEQEYSCTYMSLEQLLPEVDILITCLNKNVILLGQREFEQPGNYALSDTVAGLGSEVAGRENVFCGSKGSAGLTYLAKQRLGQRVIDNIEQFLG